MLIEKTSKVSKTRFFNLVYSVVLTFNVFGVNHFFTDPRPTPLGYLSHELGICKRQYMEELKEKKAASLR